MQRLKVGYVAEGKGAFIAAIKVGDIVISFAGCEIVSNDDLSLALTGAPRGGDMVVERDGRQLTLHVANLPLGITAVQIDYDPDRHWQTEVVKVSPELAARFERERQLADLLVTTTHAIDGYRVERYIDVITAECVYGMNIISDFFAAVTDIVGGRSRVSQDVLRDARKTCILELREEAYALGANAVIGVSLDYSEISGQGKSMLFLVASGTAVVIERVGGDTGVVVPM